MFSGIIKKYFKLYEISKFFDKISEYLIFPGNSKLTILFHVWSEV
jgi:hypothetical protein